MKELAYYQKRLKEELSKLTAELEQIAVRDPENDERWLLRKPNIEVDNADGNEAADRTEEIHIDSIVLDELDARYRLVLHALRKFDGGTYGNCEECGAAIEEDRLDANPAARTCKEHIRSAEKRAL